MNNNKNYYKLDKKDDAPLVYTNFTPIVNRNSISPHNYT